MGETLAECAKVLVAERSSQKTCEPSSLQACAKVAALTRAMCGASHFGGDPFSGDGVATNVSWAEAFGWSPASINGVQNVILPSTQSIDGLYRVC